MSLTRKGRATRQRIVRAAADLIHERGVAGTSIEDVRRVAEVSGSQVSHYFQDKHSLVRAVVDWQADAVLELEPAFDSLPGLRRWADSIVERQASHGFVGGCLFGALAGELAESDEDTRRDLAAGFERWRLVLRDELLAMREHGELRPDADPEALSLSLLAAIQGGMLIAQTQRDPAALEAVLDAVLSHVESFAVRAD
jgi:TetR/AcrR family transcriptional regulator, transcriptional repressor for nem operon